jgi:hypothetical protein
MDVYRSIIKTLFSEDDQLTIFDLGCNDGSDTMWFKNNFPNCEIHSFEFDERNFELYLNKLKYIDKIYLNKCAVSNVNSKSIAYLSTDQKNGNPNTGSNSIKKPTDVIYIDFPFIEFNETVEVETITLDTYCVDKNINKIDFIWCDIQGAEVDMIMGSMNILKNTKYMLLEVYPKMIYENSFTSYTQVLELLPDWELVYKTDTESLFKNKLL